MKRFNPICLVVIYAIAVSTPVQAQPSGRHDVDWQHGSGRLDSHIQHRIDRTQARINYERDTKSLNTQEVDRVQFDLNVIKQDVRRMERRNAGHLTADERRMLETRIDRLNRLMRWLRHNDKRRPGSGRAP